MIEFRCETCKEMRREDLIEVHKLDFSLAAGQPPGTFRRNINYCGDRLECFEGAIKRGQKEMRAYAEL